jgi:DNA-binding LacI/PurR family transcriptional regulator
VITTRDIAARLQLSVSTIGRALADDPRISEETKSRVRRAAEEMGYVGNRAARMMRGASSNVVGLVIPDIRNSFYSAIAHELSRNVAEHGFQLMLSETDDDRVAELRQLRELSASRVAGVIIVPTAHPHADSVKLLRALPHIQLLRRHPSLGAQCFGLDDFETLREGTAHLVAAGHTRIGYIGGPVELSTGAERLRGFRQALRDGGLAPDAAGVAELGPPSSVEHGRQAVRDLLAGPSAPTALVTGSVLLTLGVMEELRASGADVPGRVSVVGFGDEPGFSWWGPGLTTMGLPVSEMAAGCARSLLHRLATKSPDAADAPSAALPGTLIPRGSTAPAGAGPRRVPGGDGDGAGDDRRPPE